MNYNPNYGVLIDEIDGIEESFKDENYWYKLSISRNKRVLDVCFKYPDNINFNQLSRNSSDYAIQYLKKHPTKIDYNELSTNSHPEAIQLLKENPTRINYNKLSQNKNPEIIQMIREYINNNPDPQNLPNWGVLSENSHPDAIQLLKENPTKINWTFLSRNSHPDAIQLLKENPTKINWDFLELNKNTEALQMVFDKLYSNPVYAKSVYKKIGINPKAYNMIKKLMNKFTPQSIPELLKEHLHISMNPNKEILNILKNFPSAINWKELCENPAAIDLIETEKWYERFPNEIKWVVLSGNPNIFEDEDFHDLKPLIHKRQNVFRQELMASALHPSRITQFTNQFDSPTQDFFVPNKRQRKNSPTN
jgi:hypothetical protein